MLEAVLEDFSYLPQYKIITTCDDRLQLKLPALQVVPVRKNAYWETFRSLVKDADAILPIAPETDGILATLTRWIEEENKILLSPTTEGVKVTGDKLLTYQRFKEVGLPFPETEEIYFTENFAEKARRLGFPLILKPVDGAGCAGVFLVKSAEEMETAVSQLIQETRHNRYLIQEYIQGIHASLSLISNGFQSVPLTLNAQFLKESNRLVYKGGFVPLEHPLKQEIFCLIQRLPLWIKGLQGYLGIDLVLTQNRPVFIEINPRLTTSYIGVRKVVSFNLMEAILKAVLHGELPKEVKVTGQIPFAL